MWSIEIKSIRNTWIHTYSYLNAGGPKTHSKNTKSSRNYKNLSKKIQKFPQQNPKIFPNMQKKKDEILQKTFPEIQKPRLRKIKNLIYDSASTTGWELLTQALKYTVGNVGNVGIYFTILFAKFPNATKK